jgi:hypothetical protein
VLVRFAVLQRLNLVEEKLGGSATEVDPGLADAGQRNGCRRGEFDVVVADDADLVRDGHPMGDQPLEQTDRDQVVQGEHSGRTFVVGHRHDGAGGGPSGLDVEPLRRQRQQRGRWAAEQHGPACAVPTFTHLRDVRGATDNGEPPVPTFEQVLGCELAADEVIDGDGAPVVVGGEPVGEYDGHAQPSGELPVGAVGDRSENHSTDPQLLVQLERCSLAGRIVRAVRQQDRATGRRRDVPDPTRQVAEERIGDVHDDQADRGAVPGAQLPSRLVAHPAQLVDRFQDPAAGVRRDQVGLVQHIGDGPDRHLGQRRDVLHTDRWPIAHEPLLAALATC